MAKNTRALSGAAKDAYLKRAIKAEAEIPVPARERLTERLQGEIAVVSLRGPKPEAVLAETTADLAPATSHSATPHPLDAATEPTPPAGFDPYQLNVIVIFRTRGRDAVLAQLGDIDDVEHLRLLAREQQLGIASDLSSANDIRHAIVAAAERRIANRRAAVS